MKYLDLDCLINLQKKIFGDIELLGIIDWLKPKLELSLNSKSSQPATQPTSRPPFLQFFSA